MDHEKLVAHYSWKAIRRCPSLDIDDVKQELSISLLEAKKLYDTTTDLDFANFLGKRLSWKVSEIIRNHYRRFQAESLWANGRRNQVVNAHSESYESLCKQVVTILAKEASCSRKRRQRLEQACKLFQLLACPESITDTHDHRKPETLNLMNAAAYLGLGYVTKHRVLSEVQKAILRVLDG
jgi:DNA-directed RNA polymerase specialized sigma subunit